LKTKQLDTKWIDRRKDITISELNMALGILVNFPKRIFGSIPFGRHWFAIRKLSGTWYNLDSQLSGPIAFQNEQELLLFIKEAEEETQLFLVMRCNSSSPVVISMV